MTELEILNNVDGDMNLVDGYNCDICKNKGWVYVEVDGRTCQRECECKKIRSVIQKAKASGLSEAFTDCTFENYTTNEPWQSGLKSMAVDFYNDSEAKWLFIGGQSGCGKTHLCTAVFVKSIPLDGEAKYISWVDESRRIKQLANDLRYQELVNGIKNAKVLYIDDFLKVGGSGKPTDGDLKLAFEVINCRIALKDCTTIISSEYILSELIDFDEATFGRLYQATGKYKIGIPKDRTKNYRLK